MTLAANHTHTDVVTKPSSASKEVEVCFASLLKPDETLQYVLWSYSEGLDFQQASLPLVGASAKAVVSGGTSGNVYSVCARVETSDGQTDQRCVLVSVTPSCAIEATSTTPSAMLVAGHTLATGGTVLTPPGADLTGSHALTTAATIITPASGALTVSHAFTTSATITDPPAGDAVTWENGDTGIWENADAAIWE